MPCSDRYRRRLARIAEAGSSTGAGHLYLLTLTAPGVAPHGLWDPGRVRGTRPPCACHAGVELGEWNAAASSCWNRLRTALRRDRPVRFLRAVEVQQRGALHLHVLMWSPVPLDVLTVQRLALRAGFGCVLDLAPVVPGSRRHAYYVSKYVTKACDARDDVPWRADVVDEQTGEVRRLSTRATYRAWSASRDWGLTMAEVKAVCARAARARDEQLRRLTLAGGGEGALPGDLVPVEAGPSPPI